MNTGSSGDLPVFGTSLGPGNAPPNFPNDNGLGNINAISANEDSRNIRRVPVWILQDTATNALKNGLFEPASVTLNPMINYNELPHTNNSLSTELGNHLMHAPLRGNPVTSANSNVGNIPRFLQGYDWSNPVPHYGSNHLKPDLHGPIYPIRNSASLALPCPHSRIPESYLKIPAWNTMSNPNFNLPKGSVVMFDYVDNRGYLYVLGDKVGCLTARLRRGIFSLCNLVHFAPTQVVKNDPIMLGLDITDVKGPSIQNFDTTKKSIIIDNIFRPDEVIFTARKKSVEHIGKESVIIIAAWEGMRRS